MTTATITKPALPEDLVAQGWELHPHPGGDAWYAINKGEGLKVQSFVYAEIEEVIDHLRGMTPAPALPPGGSPAAISPDHLFKRPPGQPQRILADIACIVPGRWQPRKRFDEAKLQELADSIKEHGVLTALKVFVNEKGDFELIAGERRWRAAKLAGKTRVPVEIEEMTARQIQEISIIDNLQRQDLQPDEEGEAFEMAIKELHVSEAELARRLGVGRTYIQQRRALVEASAEVRDALIESQITFSQARGILAGTGDDQGAQKAILEWLQYEDEAGRKVSEKAVRRYAARVMADTYREELEALGWSIGALGHRRLIYSLDEAPRIWSGTEILGVVESGSAPEQPVTGKAEALPKSLTGPLEQRGYRISEWCAPWVQLTDIQGGERFLSREQIADLAAQCKAEIKALRQRFEASGYSLSPVQHGNGRWQIYHGKTLMHHYEGWADAVEIIERIERGEAAPPPPEAKEEGGRVCAMPGCSTKCAYKHWHGWNAGGKRHSGYLCDACHERLEAAEKAQEAEAEARFVEQLAPFIAQGSTRDLTLLALLASSQLLGAGGDPMAKFGKLIGEANSKESLGASVTALLFQELWGDAYKARRVMLELFGLSDEIDLDIQEEEQAS